MGKKGEGQTEDSVSSHELKRVKLGKLNAPFLCCVTLKHQFGDAGMRLLECMTITRTHNKQFSEAQPSLKEEQRWGSVCAEHDFAQRQCFLHLDTCVLMP